MAFFKYVLRVSHYRAPEILCAGVLYAGMFWMWFVMTFGTAALPKWLHN